MKALLLTLFITIGAFAATTQNKEMECNIIITMFYFSIEQENPITGTELTAAINACKYVEQHKEFVADMQLMLDDTSEI